MSFIRPVILCIFLALSVLPGRVSVYAAGEMSGDRQATVAYPKAKEVIERAYLDMLGRYPDESGLNTFLKELTANGRDEKWLRKALRNSPEGVRVKKDRRKRMLVLLSVMTAVTGVILTALVVLYRHRRTTKEFIFKVCMMAIGIVFACLFAEAFLRARDLCDSIKNKAGWSNVERAEIPAKGSRVVLQNIIRLSSDPAVIYELMPGLSVSFMGGRLATDDQGFRVTPDTSTDTNAFCIAGLGDSVMMGWGVNDEDTYLSALLRKLRDSDRKTEVKVVNMAVPGYNTAMEVRRFKVQGLQLRPKLVIIHYVENDLYLPNFIREEDRHARLTSSCLVAELSRLLGGRVKTRAFEHFVRPGDEIPLKYKSMVGESGVQAALRELIALSKSHGFKLVIITNWGVPPFLREVAAGQDIQVLELGSTISKYCKDRKITEFQGSELTVSLHDPHFSRIGHNLIADALYECLKTSGFLPGD